MAKEIDADLTMLKDDTTPVDQAYADLVKNAQDGGSLIPASTVKEAKQSIQGMKDEQLAASSLREGEVDIKLDAGQLPGEDINTTRARNQSTGIKGLKAVGGGLAVGSLIVLEQLGYLADIDTYTNLIGEVEDVSGNWWSKLMKESQEDLRESDTFKLYEQAPDENDFASQIFKWSSLEGAISSAVGFGVTGLGAASVVSKLGTMKKFKDLARLTDVAMGDLAGARAAKGALKKGKSLQVAIRQGQFAAAKKAGATQAFVGPLASSMMANFYMGQLMAADTYNQTMETLRLQGAIGDKENQISELEAQKLANDQAQEVVGLNQALLASAYLKFGGIFKRATKAKALLKDPTALNQLKQLIVRGSPTAFVENVYQEMIQMEQIHDVQTELGLASDYSADYWDRMSQLALSDRAVHAGALGIVGGPIQFAVIQKPLMGKQIKQQRERVKEQKEYYNFKDELKKQDFKVFKDFEEATKKALYSGTKEDVEFAEDMHVIHQITKMSEWGVLDYLKKDMEDIKTWTKEEAAEEGYSENYAEVADSVLAMIDNAEEAIYDNVGYENMGEVVFNQMIIDRASLPKAINLAAKYSIAQDMVKGLQDETGISLSAKDVALEGFKIKRDPKRFEGMDVIAKKALLKKEANEDIAIADYLAKSSLTEKFNKATEAYGRYDGLMKDLIARREKITSKEYQRKYAKDQESKKKNVVEAVDKKNQEDKDKRDAEATKTTTTFDTVKNAAPVETAEQTAKRFEKWKEQVEGKATIKERTFTSRDTKGEERIYSPEDLVRSVDGRFYKVLGQNWANQAKGKLTLLSMPILTETNSSGKVKKGAGVFDLKEHSFLMPEVKQFLEYGRTITGKRYAKHAKTWAPYIQPDSKLKPNNLAFKEAQQSRAERNEVISVRDMEFVTTTPKGQLEKTEFAKEYAVHELNESFVNPYRIEYKLNHTGKEGETLIDVYKIPEKGKPYKLTRLDRQANLNYTAVAQALLKGPVFGEVIGHYSNKFNIIKLLDENGNKIYNSVNDLKKASKSQLINGQVYLASKSEGTSETSKYYAVSQDGKHISTDGTLEVTIDGNKHIKSIPFNAMREGDTYALVLAPGGQIMNLALSSKNLVDLPSNRGLESLAEDFKEDHIQATREYFSELVDNLEGLEDFEVSDTVEGGEDIQGVGDVDNSLRDSEKARANKKQKETLIIDNRKGLTDHYKDNVYKIVREGYKHVSNKIGDEYQHAKNAAGRDLIRDDYFTLGASVDSNGNIVASVGVQHPNSNVATIWYNVTDNPVEYTAYVEGRRRKMNIDHFAEPFQTNERGEQVNVINKSIVDGELTTDANPTQLFGGSSATMTVDGSDIQEAGSKAAAKSREFFKTKFTEKITAVNEQTKADFIQEFEEGFQARMDETPLSTSTDDFIKWTKNFFNRTDISNTVEVMKLVNQAFTEKGIPGTEEDFLRLKHDLSPDGENAIMTLKAKATVLHQVIAEKIEDETFKIKLKDTADTTFDPGKYRTQKEGISFGVGAAVFHKDYGLATVSKGEVKGYYYIKPENTDITTKVWARDVYAKEGEFRKLFKLRDELEKAVASGNESLIKLKERAVLNKENYMVKKGLLEDKKTTEEVTDSKTTDEKSNTEANYPNVDFNIAEVMSNYVSPLMSAKIESFKETDRTMAMQSAFIKLNNNKDRYTKLANEDPFYNFTKEDVNDIIDDTVRSIPYTVKELNELINIANTKVEQATTEKQKQYFASHRNRLKTMQNMLNALIKHQQGDAVVTYKALTTRGLESVRRLPSNYNTTASAIKTYNTLKEFLSVLQSTVGSAVVAESDLVANFFNAGVGSKKVTAPTTSTKKEKPANVDKIAVDAEVVTPSKPVPTEVKTSEDTFINKLRSTVHGTLNKAPKETRDAMIAKYENMLKTEDEAFVMSVMNLEVKKLKKQYPEDTETSDQKGPMFDEDGNFIDGSNPPFRYGDAITMNEKDFNAEVAKAKEMLPNVPLKVLEDLASMKHRFGDTGLGAFDKGIRFLVKGAKEGTAYHETMHAVAELHLTSIERQQIAEEYGHDKWSRAVDEKLAEDFTKYALRYFKAKESPVDKIVSTVRNFFKRILDIFSKTRSMDTVKKVFERTVSNGYAHSQSINYLSNVALNESRASNIETFRKSLSEKENVTLQRLIDTNRIKIKC